MNRKQISTLGIGAAVLAATLLAPGVATAATVSCDPPQVLIVLDKSSSMTGLVPGTSDTKWDVAVAAISDVLNTYGSAVDFGLMIFPTPNECSPGAVHVGVGPANTSDILNALGAAPPSAGNWTPMAESLDAAAAYPPLQDIARRNYVLLITDGWQWCSPYDPLTRDAPVTSSMNLLSAGIETYTVGFGGAVDVLTLNQVAWEGGTGQPGCDPNGEDPTAPDLCYYQADDLPVLTAALNNIVAMITTEVCDGVDNDCNGTVDDVATLCATACGTGVEVCTGGVVTGCSAPPESSESCNGLDDNCDGTIDEGCSCVDGDTMNCGINVGACAAGVQSCTGGAWGPCVGATSPAPSEACNGVDDDCNGIVDDGYPCPGNEACVAGVCTPVTKPEPTIPVGDDEGLGGGCTCRVGSPTRNASPGAAVLALLLGLALVGLRRRRS